MRKEEAFTQIIKENEGIIFKITSVYTNTSEDQKDLYQEIVFQLWRGFESFRGDSKISTWMYRVALNTAFTHLRKEKRKGNRVELDYIDLKYEASDPVLEERLKQMYEQIRLLSDLEKGLILLLLEGKKYEEIASITGLTASNVGTRISRIKQKLKKQLVNS